MRDLWRLLSWAVLNSAKVLETEDDCKRLIGVNHFMNQAQSLHYWFQSCFNLSHIEGQLYDKSYHPHKAWLNAHHSPSSFTCATITINKNRKAKPPYQHCIHPLHDSKDRYTCLLLFYFQQVQSAINSTKQNEYFYPQVIEKMFVCLVLFHFLLFSGLHWQLIQAQIVQVSRLTPWVCAFKLFCL